MSETYDDDTACELCQEWEDCDACDGSGEDMHGSYDDCFMCGGSGQVIPDHCCDCGGSPYCQCCSTCGNYAGTCGCPVTVTLLDGTVKTLDVENAQPAPADRCAAAHPDDPTPCSGPAAVTVLDAHNAGADGCEHHAARLLASLDGGRVYPLPDAPEGAAIRVFQAADHTRPFPWDTTTPRTRPEQLSTDENRNSSR